MKLTIVDEGIVWKNPYPSARARVAFHGHTVNLGGGELLHAMRVSQAKTSRDGGCRIFRSRDHGKSWNETTPLVPPERQDPGFGYFTALPRLTGDGTLWAVSIRFRLAEPEDPRYTADNGGWLDGESFVCRSADRGQSWSDPQYLRPENPPGGFHNAASGVLELDTGELMVLFEPFFTGTLEALRHEVVALYSRDGGRTWGEQTVIARDPDDRLIYFDPRPARLADGRWLCLFWTHEKRTDRTLNTTAAWSGDGRRWSAPVETALWGFPTLPLVLPDGRIFAVYNYRREPQGVRCALSADGGRTWDVAREHVLWDQAARRVTGAAARGGQARPWDGSCMAEMFSWDFGVPDPTLLDDGTVLVTFYATVLDHVMHQRWVRVAVE